MLNLAILFSLVVLLNLGNSVESGVAVKNKTEKVFGGTNQPDNFDNYHSFFFFSKDYQKILQLVTFNLLGKQKSERRNHVCK